jgi:hypothetical protein
MFMNSNEPMSGTARIPKNARSACPFGETLP